MNLHQRIRDAAHFPPLCNLRYATADGHVVELPNADGDTDIVALATSDKFGDRIALALRCLPLLRDLLDAAHIAGTGVLLPRELEEAFDAFFVEEVRDAGP